MSDLLALLHTNSPLSLIHRYLDIQTIDSTAILEKLQKTSMDIDDDSERQSRPKRKFAVRTPSDSLSTTRVSLLAGVRFIDAPTNAIEFLSLSQATALMIYLGYLSINSVIQRVLSPEGSGEQVESDMFALTKSYVSQIFPLRFRLELLENIFSLLFIQQSELKLDEAVEVNEQSTHTASISLSTSDRFLSSQQSNVTNDSLRVSTSASIKTQISVRRFDTEMDEDNDDAASVCSSSMSSAGVNSHPSMYRNGLLISQQVLYHLLIFLRDQLTEVRVLHQKIKDKATDRDSVDLETSFDKCFHGYPISPDEQFTTRATKLNTIVSETLWRYQLLTANSVDVPSKEKSIDDDSDDHHDNGSVIENSTIKNLILPLRK